jgi:hypothetical protein
MDKACSTNGGTETVYAVRFITAYEMCCEVTGVKSPVLKRHAIMSYRGVEATLHAFLISALDGGW